MPSRAKTKKYRRPIYQFEQRDRVRDLLLKLNHENKLTFSEARNRLKNLTELEFREAEKFLVGQKLIKPVGRRRTRGTYIKSATAICENLIKKGKTTVPKGWDVKTAKLIGCSPLTIRDVRRKHGIQVK